MDEKLKGEDDPFSGWTPLPVQYADYTLWQHALLGSESDADSAITRQLDYWQRALANLPVQLELPTDRPRPAVASNRGASVPLNLDAALHQKLQGLARSDRPAFSFQGHPEASPGPHDLKLLFEHFMYLMVKRIQSNSRNRVALKQKSAEG